MKNENIATKLRQAEEQAQAQTLITPAPKEAVNFIFWHTKTDEEGNEKISIQLNKFIDFLSISGFKQLKLGKQKIYVQVVDNVVREVITADIKHYVINYLKTLRKEEVKKVVYGYTRLFSDSTLDFLPFLTTEFQRDSKEKAFFYFENCFVEVGRNGIVEKPYKELAGIIWANQINKHQYRRESIHDDFIFWRFFQNVCKREKALPPDQARIKTLQSILGYLLHDYKEKMRAVCLTDSVISDDPEGRTGKSIIAQALKFLRVQTLIDGKKFRHDSDFSFQKVDISTQIVFLDDVGKKSGFDIEPLFSSISEGLEVQKKNQTTFNIEAKFIFTSNRAIIAHGGSARDRIIEFEFSNYYSSAYNPATEFGGRWLYKDFTEGEWNQFYNFMLFCSQEYLTNGITESEAIALTDKRIIDGTTQNKDFLDFGNDLPRDVSLPKKEMHEKFIAVSPDYEKITQAKFTRFVKIYAREKGLTYTEGREGSPQYYVFSLQN